MTSAGWDEVWGRRAVQAARAAEQRGAPRDDRGVERGGRRRRVKQRALKRRALSCLAPQVFRLDGTIRRKTPLTFSTKNETFFKHLEDSLSLARSALRFSRSR